MSIEYYNKIGPLVHGVLWTGRNLETVKVLLSDLEVTEVVGPFAISLAIKIPTPKGLVVLPVPEGNWIIRNRETHEVEVLTAKNFMSYRLVDRSELRGDAFS